MTAQGLCSTCGTTQDLGPDGTVANHKHRIPTSSGWVRERCPGVGRKPIPGR